ncbi:MAG: HAD family phosphatase [Planctomycetota bacterium]|nr:MAG: HAD family phosphatase [Planctomycetota bacterium]REJ95241.1 MAG: HAD family phosphatase [Planctomycetota bacterium]REK27015.1 MAG: HAD family phosphatase [Planctomycetota bacterium]REK40314.1 MAG: HAD family phosphatase [Planctomycetota bacterium]
MSEGLQAVVFDLDGLMFNTEDLYRAVGTEVLRRRGKPLDDDLLDAMMGRRPAQALSIMIEWHGLDATVEELAAESEEIFVPILDNQLAPMPGLVELLATLEAAAMPKAVATSSGRQFVENVMGRFDMVPRFEFLLTAEDVHEGKPHPEIYQTAAARFDLEPAQIMVLEDSENGCKAAVAAGTFAVAVPASRSLVHDFSGASLVAESLADARIYEALGLARG